MVKKNKNFGNNKSKESFNKDKNKHKFKDNKVNKNFDNKKRNKIKTNNNNNFIDNTKKNNNEKINDNEINEITKDDNVMNNMDSMFFDFNNNIIDKLTSNTNEIENKKQINKNLTSWNYSSIIESEARFNKKQEKKRNLKLKENNEDKIIDNKINDNKIIDNKINDNKIIDNDVDKIKNDNTKNNIVNDNTIQNSNYFDRFESDLYAKGASFSNFNLSKLIIKSLAEMEYFTPTKVQEKVIPIVLNRHDILVNAETGSGKTACYLLPILQKIIMSRSSNDNKKHYKMHSNEKREKFNKNQKDNDKNISSLNCYSLILVPTRELVLQVAEMFRRFSSYIDVSYLCLCGGLNIENQINSLENGNVDVIIATPGRLIDALYNFSINYNNSSNNNFYINLSGVDTLVLDEADKLLETGFKDEIMEVLNLIEGNKEIIHNKNNKNNNIVHKTNKGYNKKTQVMLFSATLSGGVLDLGKDVLKNPIKIKMKRSVILKNLTQMFVKIAEWKDNDDFNIDKNNNKKINIKKKNKTKNSNDDDINEKNNENSNDDDNIDDINEDDINITNIANKNKSLLKSSTEFQRRISYLIYIIRKLNLHRTLIFFNTKKDCHSALLYMKKMGLENCAEINNNILQSERIKNLDMFQKGEIDFLLGTDVAGRGLDVEKITCIINFEMPLLKERYIHRVGRTARKGYLGKAITIVNDKEKLALKKLLRKEANEKPDKENINDDTNDIDNSQNNTKENISDNLNKNELNNQSKSNIPLHPLKAPLSEINKILLKVIQISSEIEGELDGQKLEKEIEHAQREIDKSINCRLFAKEISNRKKRVWFQNKKEKKLREKKARKEFRNKVKEMEID